MQTFALPDLGEGLTEAEIVRWLVKVGDEVQIDQPVVEVETAKAAVEVPVPFEGVVHELHAPEGAALAVGAPLISVSGAIDEGFQEPGVVSAQGSGNVLIGYGTPQSAPRRRRRSRAESGTGPAQPVSTPPAPVEKITTTRAVTEGATTKDATDGLSDEPVTGHSVARPGVISPVVRRLARDSGIDLGKLRGSGPDGVICRRDVEQALAARWTDESVASKEPETAEASPKPGSHTSAAGGLADAVIGLTGSRGYIAQKLSQSRREIPEATVWVDVDVTELVATRRTLTNQGAPVSLLALLARFVIAGLRRYPQLNARVIDANIEQSAKINLGFAAQTERGLVVPVVHDAQSMTLRELSEALRQRTTEARDGRLAQESLRGGTITVNNYGVFGVDGSAAIINHPEAAIVGLGRIIDRPWVVDGEIVVRKVSQLTIAFDHRVCDGGVAGGFLRYLADCLENPITLIADV